MQYDGSYSRLRIFFREPWVRIILALDLVAIIAMIIISVLNVTKTSTLTFNVTPLDATISVNGDDSYRNMSYRMHPGKYDITISHPSLTTKTFSLDIPADYNATITTFLSDDGNFDFYSLDENSASLIKLIEIASASSNLTTDQDTSAEDFIAYQKRLGSMSEFLPLRFAICGEPASRVNCDAVEVTYEFNEACDDKECFVIRGRIPELTEAVLSKVKEEFAARGFDFEKYDFIYKQDDGR